MATDYGTDLRTYPDFTGPLGLVSGPRVVAEALYRRLTTPQGTLSFHPDYGRDLRRFLNGQVTDDQLFAFKMTAERECLKDQRVIDVQCSVSFTAATFTLRATFAVTLATNVTFSFVLTVTKLDVAFFLGEA